MTANEFATLGLAEPLLRALVNRGHVTPTPIQGETAVITTQGNPVALRRAPGSQQILLQLPNGELVLLQTGRANQGTILWREVRTTSGILGWVPEDFLTITTP